ncbi:protein-export membrane protein SecF [Gammaproteobacteria bacterium 45_16_T64]|nr:protein-export membrane protein SecF [Gammaproteobacteria bacterium 45_16_T64]
MKAKIDFMGKRTVAAIFSAILLVVSIGSFVFQGFNLGLDFTGGTQVEVGYKNAADLKSIRAILKANEFGDATVQLFGKPTEVLVRIPPREGQGKAKVGEVVLNILRGADENVILKRVEFVGPQVGEELRDQSGSAMIFALGLMLVYVTLRFQFKFALGAVTALFHDVLIVMGFFSVFQITFDLTVLAAVLAVIGYSLNDTIVVADRIRENFRKLREGSGIEIINISLNQTLGRTIITSLTTLLVLTALAVLGGELIHGFAVALLVGVVIGTYSSIYVASNVLLAMDISREDFLEKEEDIPEVP